MAQGSESDYRILPSFIASTLSVLNSMNSYLKSFKHTVVFALHQKDWSNRRVFSANNYRLINYRLDKAKYLILQNEILKI